MSLNKTDYAVIVGIAVLVSTVIAWLNPIVIAAGGTTSPPVKPGPEEKLAGLKQVLSASRIQIDSTKIVYTGTEVTNVKFTLKDTAVNFTNPALKDNYLLTVSLNGNDVSTGTYTIDYDNTVDDYTITATTGATGTPSDPQAGGYLSEAEFNSRDHLGEFENTSISNATPVEIRIENVSP